MSVLNYRFSFITAMLSIELSLKRCYFIVCLVSELDLDFLEKRQNAVPNTQTIGQSLKSPIEVSPESVDRVKVIILGAPAVGKTSIIQVPFLSVDRRC